MLFGGGEFWLRFICAQDKVHVSQQAGEGIDMVFLETELRRKGLCLLPMSMLLNFS